MYAYGPTEVEDAQLRRIKSKARHTVCILCVHHTQSTRQVHDIHTVTTYQSGTTLLPPPHSSSPVQSLHRTARIPSARQGLLASNRT